MYDITGLAVNPNPPWVEEEKPVYTCDRCGKGIYHHDSYAEIRSYVCYDCLNDMTTVELLNYCGFQMETAFAPDEDRWE